MNKLLPTFEDAKGKVKVSHFVSKGGDIKGIIHVGAHDGYELEWYFKMGIDNVIAFEPLSDAYNKLVKKYEQELSDGRLIAVNAGLGLVNNNIMLHIADGDGQGSSFLKLSESVKPEKPYYHSYRKFEYAPIRTFQYFTNENYSLDLTKYNCLVVDAEGMELDVLKSFGSFLRFFDFLNIECSERPIYDGQASAREVIDYLDRYGFVQDSMTEEHNDIMFIRK